MYSSPGLHGDSAQLRVVALAQVVLDRQKKQYLVVVSTYYIVRLETFSSGLALTPTPTLYRSIAVLAQHITCGGLFVSLSL